MTNYILKYKNMAKTIGNILYNVVTCYEIETK